MSGTREMRCMLLIFAATSMGVPNDMLTPPIWSRSIQRRTSANDESPLLV